ncbi:MAG: hypothetical protein EOP05_08970 [Proteobacteria bacterium]|nr:MAG: hypothetical protein EOP05_08970 [Pseudomonadota bacterium]
MADAKQTIHSLNDAELHRYSKSIAERERAVTFELLHCLSEVDSRHLYSKFACSSLHSYCVKELRMSDGQAGRRVAASRLLRELPAMKHKILSGDISITAAAQAAVFFQKEARAGNSFVKEEKVAILETLEQKSTREVTASLVNLSQTPQIHLQEFSKPVAGGRTEVRLFLDDETMEALERLKEIFAHRDPSNAVSALVRRLALEALKKNDPLLKAERAITRISKTEVQAKSAAATENLVSAAPALERAIKSEATPTVFKQRTYIPSRARHAVMYRDHGCCTFVDTLTGARCGERKFLQIDHVGPVSKGGGSNPET